MQIRSRVRPCAYTRPRWPEGRRKRERRLRRVYVYREEKETDVIAEGGTEKERANSWSPWLDAGLRTVNRRCRETRERLEARLFKHPSHAGGRE